MADFFFDNEKFGIKNFDKQKTFSNFFPAIAGKLGIPMWVFYVNRGQGIVGFGSKDKATPIMEFFPGSIALNRVNTTGFRTFLKIDGEFCEAFSVTEKAERKMLAEKCGFSISEVNEQRGFEVKVSYFGIPNEPFGALARVVEIKNISDSTRKFEVCDGLSQLMPYGMTNTEQKEVGNLMRSFASVINLENDIPLYKMKSSTFDTTEMEGVKSANFYMSFIKEKELLKPIIDPELIFDYDDSQMLPIGFIAKTASELTASEQFSDDKLCCGFSVFEKDLKAGESVTIRTLIGSITNTELLYDEKLQTAKYFEQKYLESKELIDEITAEMKTKTAFSVFDQYMEQSYLDNVLRGGYPITLKGGEKNFCYYVYSRKHGDLERDYNWFVLLPEYFSCGEGNFRDVAQNRRSDVFFHKEVGDYNIKLFFNLIQLDGGNPLVVEPSKFVFVGKNVENFVAKYCFDNELKAVLINILKAPFSFGKLATLVYDNGDKFVISSEKFVDEILSNCEQKEYARFGEGYWVDHFTYLIDLVETYLQIYPDKEKELFFAGKDYRYFNSNAYILPRAERQAITKNGVRRQNSVEHIKRERDWAFDKNGKEIQTNLVAKMIALLLVKGASLDCENLGIDMDSNKPGWNDAMNGMPAIFGSGFSEVIETKRIAMMLIKIFSEYNESVELLKEQAEFLKEMTSLLEVKHISHMDFYDKSNDYKEKYRLATNVCVSGETTVVSSGDILKFATLLNAKFDDSIKRAREAYNGLYPTFISYIATEYEQIGDSKFANITKFQRRDIPIFAESIARSYKLKGLDHKALYEKVKNTDIYDKTLKVYKTSESLENEDLSIGRIRVFNAGWLEREACFLHMAYKYIYGLLRANLYEEFFEELKTNFVPFMKPEVYGRNPLENSSFIVTDVKTDKKLIGRGFQPRLSGANAEVISMWIEIFFGDTIFKMEGDKLCFVPKPKIAKEFFDENNKVSALFMSRTMIEYVNNNRIDTYNENAKIVKFEIYANGKCETVEGDKIIGEKAVELRDGKIDKIVAYIE